MRLRRHLATGVMSVCPRQNAFQQAAVTSQAYGSAKCCPCDPLTLLHIHEASEQYT